MKRLLFYICYFVLPALFAQTDISGFTYGAPNVVPVSLSILSVPGNENFLFTSHLDGYGKKDPVIYLNSVTDSTEILPDSKAKYVTDLRSLQDGNLEILVMDEHNTVYVLRTIQRTKVVLLDKFRIDVQRYMYDPLPLAKFHGEEILYNSNAKWYYRSNPQKAIAESRGRPKLFLQTEDHSAFVCTESILLDGKNYNVNTSNYENFFFEEGRLFASNHKMYEFNPENSAFELIHAFYTARGNKVYFVRPFEDKTVHENYRVSGNSVQPVDSSVFYKYQTLNDEDFTLEVSGPIAIGFGMHYNAIGTRLKFKPENYPSFRIDFSNQQKQVHTKVLNKQNLEVLLEIQYSDYQTKWLKVDLQDSTKSKIYRPINRLKGTKFLTELSISNAPLQYCVLDLATLEEVNINPLSLPLPNVPYPTTSYITAYSQHVEVNGIYGVANARDYPPSFFANSYLVPITEDPVEKLYSARSFMATPGITKGITNYQNDTLTIRDFKTGVDTRIKLSYYLNTTEYAAYFLSNDLVFIPTFLGLYRYDFNANQLQLESTDVSVLVDPATEKIVVHTREYFSQTFEYYVLDKGKATKNNLGKIYGTVEFINNLLICRTNTGLKLFNLNNDNEFVEIPPFWKGDIKSFARFNSKILALSTDNILYSSEDYPVHVPVATGNDPVYSTEEDLYFPDFTAHKLIRYNVKNRKFYLLNEDKLTFKKLPNYPFSFTVERENDLIISYIYGSQILQHRGMTFQGSYDYSIQANGSNKGCYALGSYELESPQVYVFPCSNGTLQWTALADLGEATSLNETFQVKVYPNPGTDYMQVQANGVIDNAEIWDMTGKLLLQGGKTRTINVKNLPENTYILKVESGLKQSYTRIIIRK